MGGFLLGNCLICRGLRLHVKKDEAHTHTQPNIHSLMILPMLVYVVHGLFFVFIMVHELAAIHHAITSNIVHSYLMISQRSVLFPFYHPIKIKLTSVVGLKP